MAIILLFKETIIAWNRFSYLDLRLLRFMNKLIKKRSKKDHWRLFLVSVIIKIKVIIKFSLSLKQKYRIKLMILYKPQRGQDSQLQMTKAN